MAFTAFACDELSRRVVGWRTTDRIPTELPLDARRWRSGRASARAILTSTSNCRALFITRIPVNLAFPHQPTRGRWRACFRRQLRQRSGRVDVGLYKLESVRPDGPWRPCTINARACRNSTWGDSQPGRLVVRHLDSSTRGRSGMPPSTSAHVATRSPYTRPFRRPVLLASWRSWQGPNLDDAGAGVEGSPVGGPATARRLAQVRAS